MFTSYENVVSWKINLQAVVSLSTTKGEYIACGEAIKEALWLKCLMERLEVCKGKVKVMCNNQSSI